MRLVNLMPLQEIDFPNQRAFDQYNKIHKLRPDTEVTVAGRKTTAGRAALNTKPVKGTSVFGGSNTKKELNSREVGDYLNKIVGSNGLAQMNDNGAIEYNLGDGEYPNYTLYIGDDERHPGKHRVSIEVAHGNDPKKLQGKVDKSFDNQSDAMKFAGQVAKKYKTELEMDAYKKTKSKDDIHPKLKDLYKQQFGTEPGDEKPTPGTQFKNTENNQTMTLKKYDNLGNAIVTSDALPGYEFTWPADVVDNMIKAGKSEEPFEGGDSVLNKVPELLPVGSGFTHKQTGNDIVVKGYKDNHMLVSYEKYPNKILKWPLKQFLKMTANKELQFQPKSK